MQHRRGIELACQAHHSREGVSGIARLKLINEPETLLRKGKWYLAGTLRRRERGNLVRSAGLL